MFLPSFRFNDAICSEVGVVSLIFFFVRLGLGGLVSYLFTSEEILFSGELPLAVFLASSFGIGGEDSLDTDLLKGKGQILQFVPCEEPVVEVPPA
jgi:hypothetical protein